jgi:hypothetical protein
MLILCPNKYNILAQCDITLAILFLYLTLPLLIMSIHHPQAEVDPDIILVLGNCNSLAQRVFLSGDYTLGNRE